MISKFHNLWNPPINRRWNNIPIIKCNASDLQLMAPEGLHLLPTLQVPHQHQRVHSPRHNPTFREFLVRRNPCQGPHETGVTQQNPGRHELAAVGRVLRPQPNGSVPGRRRYALVAAHAYFANLNRCSINWKKIKN